MYWCQVPNNTSKKKISTHTAIATPAGNVRIVSCVYQSPNGPLHSRSVEERPRPARNSFGSKVCAPYGLPLPVSYSTHRLFFPCFCLPCEHISGGRPTRHETPGASRRARNPPPRPSRPRAGQHFGSSVPPRLRAPLSVSPVPDGRAKPSRHVYVNGTPR